MARGLSASELLAVWERGCSRHPLDRALLILAVAEPGVAPEALPALTAGQRDAALLAVHAATFGPSLDAVASCPRCAGEVEFTAPCTQLVADPPGDPGRPWTWSRGAWRLRLRCPDSRDLARLASAADAEEARTQLLECCLVEASRDGRPVAAGELPPSVIAGIAEEIAAADPAADVQFRIECPDCGERWDAIFDAAAFLWAEIAATARRLLSEVDALARAYGWREADILAMSATRRQLYLEVAG